VRRGERERSGQSKETHWKVRGAGERSRYAPARGRSSARKAERACSPTVYDTVRTGCPGAISRHAGSPRCRFATRRASSRAFRRKATTSTGSLLDPSGANVPPRSRADFPMLEQARCALGLSSRHALARLIEKHGIEVRRRLR
jgi:hypothetical protein